MNARVCTTCSSIQQLTGTWGWGHVSICCNSVLFTALTFSSFDHSHGAELKCFLTYTGRMTCQSKDIHVLHHDDPITEDCKNTAMRRYATVPILQRKFIPACKFGQNSTTSWTGKKRNNTTTRHTWHDVHVLTTSVTFLYDSGASSMTSLGLATRIEMPFASSDDSTSL